MIFLNFRVSGGDSRGLTNRLALLNIDRRFGHYRTMPFSESYHLFKNYVTPVVRDKHIRRLDREFWEPSGCKSHMSVLDIGCGTGLFLAYLEAKGVSDFLGIDAKVKSAGEVRLDDDKIGRMGFWTQENRKISPSVSGNEQMSSD